MTAIEQEVLDPNIPGVNVVTAVVRPSPRFPVSHAPNDSQFLGLQKAGGMIVLFTARWYRHFDPDCKLLTAALAGLSGLCACCDTHPVCQLTIAHPAICIDLPTYSGKNLFLRLLASRLDGRFTGGAYMEREPLTAEEIESMLARARAKIGAEPKAELTFNREAPARLASQVWTDLFCSEFHDYQNDRTLQMLEEFRKRSEARKVAKRTTAGGGKTVCCWGGREG